MCWPLERHQQSNNQARIKLHGICSLPAQIRLLVWSTVDCRNQASAPIDQRRKLYDLFAILMLLLMKLYAYWTRADIKMIIAVCLSHSYKVSAHRGVPYQWQMPTLLNCALDRRSMAHVTQSSTLSASQGLNKRLPEGLYLLFHGVESI